MDIVLAQPVSVREFTDTSVTDVEWQLGWPIVVALGLNATDAVLSERKD